MLDERGEFEDAGDKFSTPCGHNSPAVPRPFEMGGAERAKRCGRKEHDARKIDNKSTRPGLLRGGAQRPAERLEAVRMVVRRAAVKDGHVAPRFAVEGKALVSVLQGRVLPPISPRAAH